MNITLEISKEAKDFIIDNAYDAMYGARPIKRYVTHNIETLIADKILRDELKPNSKILIDVKDQKLIVKD